MPKFCNGCVHIVFGHSSSGHRPPRVHNSTLKRHLLSKACGSIIHNSPCVHEQTESRNYGTQTDTVEEDY